MTKALVMRHLYLQNISAGSCIVLRHAIKEIQGIYFNTLWDMLRSDDADESEAAEFILGEIGGVGAFQKILNILRGKQHRKENLGPNLIPCLTHVIGRYYEIMNEGEPTAEMGDVETGETKRVALRKHAPDMYDVAEDCENEEDSAQELTPEEEKVVGEYEYNSSFIVVRLILLEKREAEWYQNGKKRLGSSDGR